MEDSKQPEYFTKAQRDTHSDARIKAMHEAVSLLYLYDVQRSTIIESAEAAHVDGVVLWNESGEIKPMIAADLHSELIRAMREQQALAYSLARGLDNEVTRLKAKIAELEASNSDKEATDD